MKWLYVIKWKNTLVNVSDLFWREWIMSLGHVKARLDLGHWIQEWGRWKVIFSYKSKPKVVCKTSQERFQRGLKESVCNSFWHDFQENLGTNPKTNLCDNLLKFIVEWEVILYGSIQVIQQESENGILGILLHENQGSLRVFLTA